MAQEIEKKYKLDVFPHKETADGQLRVLSRRQIEQTYLALHEDEELRVRKLTDLDTGAVQYTHTFKKGWGLIRQELETAISVGLYEQITSRVGWRALVKVRTTCRTEDASTVVEIDSYPDVDGALHVVEVEFSSEEEAQDFTAPAWFGEEITSDKAYSNKQMWRRIQEDLEP